MTLGILEPRGGEHVAGTVQRNAPQQESAEGLKRDGSKKYILVPQPSEDPNDPLVGCTVP